MPGFDKTGPQGMGPKTGRGLGPCGRGFGRCCGFGRGMGGCFGWNAPRTPSDSIAYLKDYIKALQEELEDAQKNLTDLQKQS